MRAWWLLLFIPLAGAQHMETDVSDGYDEPGFYWVGNGAPDVALIIPGFSKDDTLEATFTVTDPYGVQDTLRARVTYDPETRGRVSWWDGAQWADPAAGPYITSHDRGDHWEFILGDPEVGDFVFSQLTNGTLHWVHQGQIDELPLADFDNSWTEITFRDDLVLPTRPARHVEPQDLGQQASTDLRTIWVDKVGDDIEFWVTLTSLELADWDACRDWSLDAKAGAQPFAGTLEATLSVSAGEPAYGMRPSGANIPGGYGDYWEYSDLGLVHRNILRSMEIQFGSPAIVHFTLDGTDVEMPDDDVAWYGAQAWCNDDRGWHEDRLGELWYEDDGVMDVVLGGFAVFGAGGLLVVVGYAIHRRR